MAVSVALRIAAELVAVVKIQQRGVCWSAVSRPCPHQGGELRDMIWSFFRDKAIGFSNRSNGVMTVFILIVRSMLTSRKSTSSRSRSPSCQAAIGRLHLRIFERPNCLLLTSTQHSAKAGWADVRSCRLYRVRTRACRLPLILGVAAPALVPGQRLATSVKQKN